MPSDVLTLILSRVYFYQCFKATEIAFIQKENCSVPQHLHTIQNDTMATLFFMHPFTHVQLRMETMGVMVETCTMSSDM